MKLVYPVILTTDKECYLAEIPDFDIITQGKDLSDAIYMAKDAIHLTVLDMLEDNKTIPSASDISDFKSHDNSLITFVNLEI